MPLTVITVCVVFLISNVSGCATGNSFFVTNITEANIVPFPRRETLPKPNYIVLPNHQSATACMDWGKQARLLFCRSKEHFFSLGGFMKDGKFIWRFFCCLLLNIFENISEWPSPLLQLQHLMSFIGSTFEVQLSVNRCNKQTCTYAD